MDFISREEQLEVLIDRYQNLIFSICYKMTSDYFAAEDLAQETFLTAYEKSTLFDGRNEKAWICRIATNKSLDYLKHSGRRSIPTEEEYFVGQQAKRSSPEEQCLEEEVRESLEHYYYEMGVSEMAAKRNKNPKTVQTQIYRARGMLRKIMGQEGKDAVLSRDREKALGKGGRTTHGTDRI